MAMLGPADQIRALNEAQLNAGRVRVEATFSQFRRRRTLILGLTIGLGLPVRVDSLLAVHSSYSGGSPGGRVFQRRWIHSH
jgi:hypothetical protein